MQVLRQSTAIDVRLGPFVDATDGVTPETGITLGAADQAEVLKADGAATAAMSGTFAAVTGADGWYDYTLSTTDTNTVGTLELVVQDSSVCLPVFAKFQVVEENVYDAMFASSAALGTDVASILSDTGELQTDWTNGGRLDLIIDAILVDTGTTLDTHLTDIKGATFSGSTDSLEAIRNRGDSAWTGSATTSDSGTAQAGSTTTITLDAGAPSTDNILEGHLIYISAGTGAGQAKAIDENGYNGTTKVATIIGEWEVTPDNTSVYEVYPDAITEFTAAPTAAAVADAVWDESTTGHTSAGTFGEQLKNDVDAILVDTNELQSDWTNGGRLDLIIDDILVDTGTTLDGAISTIDSNVDAILVDTATLGSPAGADFAADIAAVKTDTAAILVDTGTTLDGKIDTIDANVDSILADTGTDGVVLAADQGVDVVKISGNTAAADNLEATARAAITGQAQTGTLSTTVMTSNLTGYADDELIGRVIVWYSGDAAGQASDITDYANTSGTVTYTAINTAPANADLFVIV